MIHKIQHAVEGALLGITIMWQPLFGMLASACAIVYYASMTKVNVVDKYHGGSWARYIKSIIKRTKKVK
jgi:hypothetical protein